MERLSHVSHPSSSTLPLPHTYSMVLIRASLTSLNAWVRRTSTPTPRSFSCLCASGPCTRLSREERHLPKSATKSCPRCSEPWTTLPSTVCATGILNLSIFSTRRWLKTSQTAQTSTTSNLLISASPTMLIEQRLSAAPECTWLRNYTTASPRARRWTYGLFS